MVIFALGLMVLMGFSGIAIDGGNVYYQQQRMQIAADAAALGGARALANGQSDTRSGRRDREPWRRPTALTRSHGSSSTTIAAYTSRVKHIFDSYFARLYGYETFTVSAVRPTHNTSR